jgi:AdoMet-dependent rRNA methyltransferase SPB1
MPANSMIIGVDLAPIKPIPRTITFQCDITTDRCRAMIKSHLKTWKADTVLHDGAPNVGTAWVQDAYSQAELVLQAMKLATEFLIEGGTFVTKVFRSKDYNALLWVFNRLFTKVEATKPPASRSVSAEIFVVCRGFKAPKRIDPKFLDPRSVFAELSGPAPNNEAKVFNPEKKRRKREGYDEGDYTQFREASASEFIQTTDPIAMLGSLNRLSFEQKGNGDIALAALNRLPETTAEIRESCSDLKVLGRKEFRLLLRWRLKAREIFGLATKKQQGDLGPDGEEVAEITPMDEELRIQEELQQLNARETARRKRERRRANEQKQREIVRMQMRMITPTEIGLDHSGPRGEDSLFALKTVDVPGAIDRVSKGRMAVPAPVPEDSSDSDSASESDEEQDRLDRELDYLYERYQERKSESDARHRAKKARQEHGDGDWTGFSDDEQDSSDGFVEEQTSEDESASDNEENSEWQPLTSDMPPAVAKTNGLTQRASMFFDQDIFKDIDLPGIGSEDDSAVALDTDSTGESRSGGNADRRSDLNRTSGKSFVEAEPDTNSQSQIGKDVSGAADDSDSNQYPQPDGDFEVVKGRGSEWEKQSGLRQDGRLGERIGHGLTCDPLLTVCRRRYYYSRSYDARSAARIWPKRGPRSRG